MAAFLCLAVISGMAHMVVRQRKAAIPALQGRLPNFPDGEWAGLQLCPVLCMSCVAATEYLLELKPADKQALQIPLTSQFVLREYLWQQYRFVT